MAGNGGGATRDRPGSADEALIDSGEGAGGGATLGCINAAREAVSYRQSNSASSSEEPNAEVLEKYSVLWLDIMA